ncbi:putative toxin-antitoxin system toxin component, PIN family [Bacillus subtilis]|uniref:putative toxin-antitoxin system toxin component, PIN family n=1 Tax=Bacillus subtilis TaxID=1423 RepID=UPI003982ADFF
MKAVVDTSTLLRALLTKFSEPKYIFSKIENGDFELLMTAEMAGELNDAFTSAVMRAAKKSPKVRQRYNQFANAIAIFILGATQINTKTKITSISDPEDAMFLECAVDGDAEYCISSDHSIFKFKEYSQDKVELALVADIKIFNPQQYVNHEKALKNPKPKIKTTGA